MPDRGCFGVLGTLVRTVWLVLLVWSVVVVGAARPLLVPVAQSTDLDLRAVDRCVDAHLERVGLPGAVIVITRGNEPLYVHGYGHDSRGNPMTDTTPVPIASLSKSFTALAVMQLVDDGRVDLDVPVVRYLPEFMMADPRSTRITVRQLLDHTSGMADASFPEKSLPAPSSLQESVASLREASLSADPGTKFQYHNPNYWVAARLVEVVSGERFPRLSAASRLRARRDG